MTTRGCFTVDKGMLHTRQLSVWKYRWEWHGFGLLYLELIYFRINISQETRCEKRQHKFVYRTKSANSLPHFCIFEFIGLLFFRISAYLGFIFGKTIHDCTVAKIKSVFLLSFSHTQLVRCLFQLICLNCFVSAVRIPSIGCFFQFGSHMNKNALIFYVSKLPAMSDFM